MIFGMYEMQILDSYRNPVEPTETLGAVYGISPRLCLNGSAARPVPPEKASQS